MRHYVLSAFFIASTSPGEEPRITGAAVQWGRMLSLMSRQALGSRLLQGAQSTLFSP
jgi:hypothetical protein